MGLFGSKRKPKISVDHLFVSSVVLLTYPGYDRFEMANKLRETERKGYDVGHRFRPSIGGSYSVNLEAFMGGLENAGYIENGDSGYVLTEKGRVLLEDEIVRIHRRDPETTRMFSRDMGFDIDAAIGRCLDRHPED